ncbi:radical SAM protein [bacterium]|nr:MAG: radical SAM protein [bacterium]
MFVKNNKKIVFVNPPLDIDKRYGKLGRAGGSEAPISLCYLSSVSRAEGFIAKIIDAQACRLDLKRTVEQIKIFDPGYVGITASTMAIDSASELARVLKISIPGTKIIIGGCHVTALPEDTLKNCRDFDVGVIGEGEDTLKELLRAFNGGRQLKSICGIIGKDDAGTYLTSPRSRIKDLDNLPFPDFDLLGDISKRYRLPAQSLMGQNSFSLVTSRGCFGKCSFCDKNVFGSHITMHSADYIVDMVEFLNKKYRITNVMFEDDNFMISKKRLFAFGELIRRKKLNIAWTCLARIDSVDEEVLKIAKDAGCWQVSYGIESGSQRILDFYKKDINLDKIKNVITLTKKLGLKSKGFFMWGNPGEDRHSIMETLRFIKNLSLDDISITFATPYPGSEIWPDIDSYGSLDRSFEKMSCFNLVFVPNNLDAKFLFDSRKQALKEFYFRPRIILSYLSRLKSLSQMKDLIFSAFYLFFYVFRKEKIDE